MDARARSVTGIGGVGAWWLVVCWGLTGTAGCAGRRPPERAVIGEARTMAAAVGRGDRRRTQAAVLPAQRGYVAWEAMLAEDARGAWRKRLAAAKVVEVRAQVLLGRDLPVEAVQSDGGWRFSEDPTLLYGNGTPRGALRALVWASRTGRYDVLLTLAPRRYRVGLSAEKLKKAWEEGPVAADLARRRDRLARHLGAPIYADDHEAVLDMGDEGQVRLEREGPRWVVVDF